MPRFRIGFFSLLIWVSVSYAQNQSSGSSSTPYISDPQATSLAAKAVSALTGGTTIADVSLSGTVTAIVGPDTQEGTATFAATSAGQSRVDLDLANGKISEIRNVNNGSPSGAWIGKDGAITSFAGQNCLTDASWFFPALSWLAENDPTILLSYVGQEQRSGTPVYHLRSFRYSIALLSQWNLTDGGTSIAQLSMTDFYLDSATLLPVSVVFNTHPDTDDKSNIPIEIDFSNYQPMNGILVPTHIQKYLQGGLILDITVDNAVVNSGLPGISFSIQ